jgi:hypothetical protein
LPTYRWCTYRLGSVFFAILRPLKGFFIFRDTTPWVILLLA